MFPYRPGPKLMMIARSVALPWSALGALANRHGWHAKFQVGIEPYLDPAGLSRWREAISSSRIYLEYGTGGSTIEAVRTAKLVISVETDERYLRAVEKKVSEIALPRAAFHPLLADIGMTVAWGRPLIPWPTRKRLTRWGTYSAVPWRLIDELKAVPDFIFIDGRFRAACVLESFLRLPDDADCLFMLDDFVLRKSHYQPALAFATKVEPAGKSIVFRRDPKFDRSAARLMLSRCRANPE